MHQHYDLWFNFGDFVAVNSASRAGQDACLIYEFLSTLMIPGHITDWYVRFFSAAARTRYYFSHHIIYVLHDSSYLTFDLIHLNVDISY